MPDPPGSVRFWTEVAKRRYIRIPYLGDSVEFVAPRTRRWPGQGDDVLWRQVVNRRSLPDTVTCGRGYIEVLAFSDEGILVNEVRTHGDPVLAFSVTVAGAA
jgi:hypothetical protein